MAAPADSPDAPEKLRLSLGVVARIICVCFSTLSKFRIWLVLLFLYFGGSRFLVL